MLSIALARADAPSWCRLRLAAGLDTTIAATAGFPPNGAGRGPNATAWAGPAGRTSAGRAQPARLTPAAIPQDACIISPAGDYRMAGMARYCLGNRPDGQRR